MKLKSKERFRQISFGYRHVLMLTWEGEVLGAGLNLNYELGLGLQESEHCSNYLSLVKIKSLESY